jgi:hypothetical protein
LRRAILATQKRTLDLAREPPEARSGLRDGAAAASLLLAAFLSVVVFLPPEGRIAAPLHDGVTTLLGRATFMLPLALGFVGVLLALDRVRPDARLPRRRLAGVVLLCLTALPAEHLMSSSDGGTGVVGQWLSSWLLDRLGGPLSMLLLAALFACGVTLTFNPRFARPWRPPHAEG